MKVKILKSSMPTFWYRNRIGEELSVDYNLDSVGNPFISSLTQHYIRSCDSVITELPEEFCVKRCNVKEKWCKYIKWLDKTYGLEFPTYGWDYYGKIKGYGGSLRYSSFGTEIHIDDMIRHIDYMESQLTINMEKQKLSRQGLKEIHSVACPNWKDVLEHYGSRNPLENYIELTQEEVNKMFEVSTKEQLPIVSKHLKQDDGSVDVTKFIVEGKGILDDNKSSYIIRDREMGKYRKKSFLLSQWYDWEIKEDELGFLCLIPTKKK